MPDVPDRPVLRKVPDVELLKVGEWPLSTGTVEFTTEDLAAAVRAAQSPSVSRPVIKLGHSDPRFDGEPAVGWVDNLRLADEGSTLVGDLCGVPAWLADIMPSAYPNRSIEGFFNYRDQTGTVHDFALTGLALLGVSPPAVGALTSLSDIAALYEVTATAGRDGPEKGIRIMPDKLLASASVEDVRRHFYEHGPGKDSWMWIEEMFLDPAEVIAMDDENNTLKRIPFTVASDSITWGEAVDVKREYVAASGRTPAAVWASAEESRPRPDLEKAPEDTPEEEHLMEFDDIQIKSLTDALDLDETAAAADIVAAVEKLVEQAKTPAEESIEAAARRQGMQLVAASAFEAMQRRVDELTDKNHRRIVDDAVAAGKFMPASRDAVLDQLNKGLISEAAIIEMAPIVTMAGAERGHGSQAPDDEPLDVRDTDTYKAWKF